MARDAQGWQVGHRDRMRTWWTLSVVFPLLPFARMAAHAARGHEIALGQPLSISDGLMPLLDAPIGENGSNPPEAGVPQLEADGCYRAALRELPGGIRHAWTLERERLGEPDHGPFSVHNTLLQRHSDHPAWPSRRCQSLRHFEQLPQLPSGCFGMFPLPCVPGRWFRVMDPRLMALPHAQGQLDRVNVDPRRRAALANRYGDAGSAAAARASAG